MEGKVIPMSKGKLLTGIALGIGAGIGAYKLAKDSEVMAVVQGKYQKFKEECTEDNIKVRVNSITDKAGQLIGNLSNVNFDYIAIETLNALDDVLTKICDDLDNINDAINRYKNSNKEVKNETEVEVAQAEMEVEDKQEVETEDVEDKQEI